MTNILVCDDDKEIVEAIEIYLVQEGYHVIKAYDGEQAIRALKENDVQAVIPPIQRGNRSLIEYDKYLYKMRHIIGNTFLSLKQWRAVATRYAKRSSSFLAAIQVRCIALWCKIL